MIRAKIFAIHAFVVVFIAIALTGLCGAFGVVTLSDTVMATAFIGPCLGIITAALNAKHLFEDPEAITTLKQEHHDEILRLKALHAEDKSQVATSNAASKEEDSKKIKSLQQEVRDLTPKPYKPISPSAGGGLPSAS